MGTSIERQANKVYEEIKNESRHGPVKTIPPPPGYKPPKPLSFYRKHKLHYSRPMKDII